MPKDFYKIWVFPLKNMGLPREEFVGIKVSPLQGSKLTFCLGASCQLTEKFWSPDRKFWSPTYCCGATEGSEQQHNQDLKEIYKGATNSRIHHFLPQCIAFNHTFYHNALHLTRVHCATNNSNENTGK